MPLPSLNDAGDLPDGLHRAALEEVMARFGTSNERRREMAARLRRIYGIDLATGQVERFIIFGSFITGKPEPNDIDIILVMRDDFRVAACVEETGRLFDPRAADAEFGASIFWIRPALLLSQSVEQFLNHWKVKRDGSTRGIVEVKV